MAILLRPWGHLHFRDLGPAGAPALIFVNSLGTDLRMWEAVATLLPAHRCILTDKRGHGLSATPAAPWTVEDLAADVVALMDHLAIAQAGIVGCSVGGMVAQALAVAAPERVSALVLSNTAAQIGTADSWQTRIDLVRDGGMAVIADAVIDRWFSAGFRASPEVLAWKTLLLRCDPAGYIGTCQALARADFRSAVQDLRLPVLMLAGSADLATPPALVAETAALIPGARLEVLEGSGHIPAIDAPEEVARLISEFLEDGA